MALREAQMPEYLSCYTTSDLFNSFPLALELISLACPRIICKIWWVAVTCGSGNQVRNLSWDNTCNEVDHILIEILTNREAVGIIRLENIERMFQLLGARCRVVASGEKVSSLCFWPQINANLTQSFGRWNFNLNTCHSASST